MKRGETVYNYDSYISVVANAYYLNLHLYKQPVSITAKTGKRKT